VMSPTEAAGYAQQEYTLKNANAYRGSLNLRLSQTMELDSGGQLDALKIAPKNMFLRRTYMLGEATIYITQVDCDLDNDTCAVSVGSNEERSLYQPWKLPEITTKAHSVRHRESWVTNWRKTHWHWANYKSGPKKGQRYKKYDPTPAHHTKYHTWYESEF
jgi:hypothetical protein